MNSEVNANSRIHARCDRFNIHDPQLSHSIFDKLMNMTLDEMISYEEIEENTYMKDFYNETTLSREWINLPDNEKERILDADLEEYMLCRENEYFTKDEIISLYTKYGNPEYPVEEYCLDCANCTEYSFPCLNCAKFVFDYNLGCGNPENMFDIETPLDIFKLHKNLREIKDMIGKQA